MLCADPVEASLRAMWPLVFSREEPVRGAAIGSAADAPSLAPLTPPLTPSPRLLQALDSTVEEKGLFLLPPH